MNPLVRRTTISLWRHIFLRVALAWVVLMSVAGGLGYVLVTRPVLERHAQGLTTALWPEGDVSCSGLPERVDQLAREGLPGIHWQVVLADERLAAGWLLPFDALLVERMAQARGHFLAARSSVAGLAVQFSCGSSVQQLFFERAAVLGASPDLALLVWVLALMGGGLGTAVWLTASLVQPLQDVVRHVRDTPLGAPAEESQAPSPIGELAQLVREIDALRERASDAVASRSALLMGLSHDLRRPLARVRLILDTAQLLHADDVRDMRADVRELQESLDEFMRAANAMASPAQDDAGRAVWSRLQLVLGQPRLVFGPPPAACSPPVNAAALQRVATHLIDNALRHTRGLVTVDWQSDRDGWMLTVGDEGPGMSPDRWHWALRPFNSDARPDAGGVHGGLGLALTRILCEHNGWTLSTRPRVPNGWCIAVSGSMGSIENSNKSAP